MNQSPCFFITGVNGAGKSTLVPLLKKILPSGYTVVDFDQRGVPKNVDAQWRQQTTRHWLRVAKRNAKKNIQTVVCGLSKPQEIYTLATKKQNKGINIAFLEVSSIQIRKRLRRRFSSPAKVRNLKNVTGLSVEECIKKNIEHARVLRKECKRYHCQVFNTTTTTPPKTAEKIARWVVRQ